MTITLALMRRNLQVFFRDKLNVFFSLLGAIVLFLLYALFLGNSQVNSISDSLPGVPRSDVAHFMNAWMFSGIVLITTVTTGLAALSALVEDSQTGRFKDFLVSPIKKAPLVAGYVLSAAVVAIIMSTFTLVFSVVYLWAIDGHLMGTGPILRSFGYVILCALAFTALSAFLVSFMTTAASQAALNTIVGTLTGFIAAAYIPIVAFPQTVANVVSALPWAQGGMLLRREFASEALASITASDSGAEESLRSGFGLDLSVGSWEVPALFTIFFLVAITLLFTGIGAVRIRSRIS